MSSSSSSPSPFFPDPAVTEYCSNILTSKRKLLAFVVSRCFLFLFFLADLLGFDSPFLYGSSSKRYTGWSMGSSQRLMKTVRVLPWVAMSRCYGSLLSCELAKSPRNATRIRLPQLFFLSSDGLLAGFCYSGVCSWERIDSLEC